MSETIDGSSLIDWVDRLIENIESAAYDIERNPYLSMYRNGVMTVRDEIIERIRRQKDEIE